MIKGWDRLKKIALPAIAARQVVAGGVISKMDYLLSPVMKAMGGQGE